MNDNLEHKHLRFIFAEYGKISAIGGENALAVLIGNLYDKIEYDYGTAVARLSRIFHGHKTHSHSRFRYFCCIPIFFLVIMFVVAVVALIGFLRVKLDEDNGWKLEPFDRQEKTFVSVFCSIILIGIIGSSTVWVRVIWSLLRSPKSQIMRRTRRYDHTENNRHTSESSRFDSYIFELKREVELISQTIKTIDALSNSCTRLVIIIDGLDSCEQSKVLQVLEIVHVLFTKESDPYICVLAVDPHLLVKGIEGNLTAVFRNGAVNGNEYMRTIIHLPVYLQIDLTKAKALSKSNNNRFNFKRRDTSMSENNFSPIIQQKTNKKKKNKNRRSKPMSAYDLTDQLMKSDYFLDINPRNLRRLINIIALTGRLLRAYHISFTWRLLANWIYLIEQWPYRSSWFIMYFEENENEFSDETTPLFQIYEKIKSQIPVSNEPLLELDRSTLKFEKFLQNCTPKLTVSILKKILPCTCNLDPYLIKLIKDSLMERNENMNITNTMTSSVSQSSYLMNSNAYYGSGGAPVSFSGGGELERIDERYRPENDTNNNTINKTQSEKFDFYPDLDDSPSSSDKRNLLLEMTVDEICDSLNTSIQYMSNEFKDVYNKNLKKKNINGQVLMYCDINELKSEMEMTFGDWQLFKSWILKQRYVQEKVLTKNLIHKKNQRLLLNNTNNNNNSTLLTNEVSFNDTQNVQHENNTNPKRKVDFDNDNLLTKASSPNSRFTVEKTLLKSNPSIDVIKPGNVSPSCDPSSLVSNIIEIIETNEWSDNEVAHGSNHNSGHPSLSASVSIPNDKQARSRTVSKTCK
jgi:ankyrin repeat-rich membrane spanning protein